jgi:hypothetical protein
VTGSSVPVSAAVGASSRDAPQIALTIQGRERERASERERERAREKREGEGGREREGGNKEGMERGREGGREGGRGRKIDRQIARERQSVAEQLEKMYRILGWQCRSGNRLFVALLAADMLYITADIIAWHSVAEQLANV